MQVILNKKRKDDETSHCRNYTRTSTKYITNTYSINKQSPATTTLELIDYHNKTHSMNINSM